MKRNACYVFILGLFALWSIIAFLIFAIASPLNRPYYGMLPWDSIEATSSAITISISLSETAISAEATQAAIATQQYNQINQSTIRVIQTANALIQAVFNFLY